MHFQDSVLTDFLPIEAHLLTVAYIIYSKIKK